MSTQTDRDIDRILDELNDAPSGPSAESAHSELAALLRESPEAREAWINHCMTEAMLESDELLAETVHQESLPDNVVKLSDQGNGRFGRPSADGERSLLSKEAVRDSSDPLPVRSGRVAVWAVAAVFLIGAVLAVFAFRSLSPSTSGAPEAVDISTAPVERLSDGDDVASAEPDVDPVDPGEELDARRRDYEQMLLAEVTPGSLSRPPTPFVSTTASAAVNGAAIRVSFNRDIRPILSENCVECHGPDAAARKAELRLDREIDAVTELAAFEAGESEAPVVKGRPDLSALIDRIITDDVDDVMPPLDSHKSLTAQQIELLKRWVTEGAEWEEHWAFAAPQVVAVFDEKADAANRIDEFVEARLKSAGLDFSPEADRQTLIRRATLDLTGLPPAPEDVEAFLVDTADAVVAFEKVVDRLLASPAYGEHRGRYWLDAARYADTHGLHLDNYREMWPYRDWVIDAYNNNMPFDQFTIEQLAGDLLENPTQSQLVATGFNRCNVTTSEGGAIAEEFDVRYAIDRVSTTSTVWLGLTTGCAQCHDHKYDPISMREFYQLFAFFNNTTQAAMDKNIPDTPPVIRVYEDEKQEQEEKSLAEAVVRAKQSQKVTEQESEPAFQEWLAQVQAKPEIFAVDNNAAPLGQVAVYQTGSKQLEGFTVTEGTPFTISMSVQVPPVKSDYVPLLSQIDEEGRGLRVGIDQSNRGLEIALFGKGGEDAKGGILRVRQINSVKSGSRLFLTVVSDGSRDPKGITVFSGDREMTRSRYPYLEKNDLHDTFSAVDGTPMLVEADAKVLADVRIFDRALAPDEVKLLNEWRGNTLKDTIKKAPEKRSEKDTATLRNYYLTTSAEAYRQATADLASAQLSLNAFQRRVPVTHVMNENEGVAMAHILNRGEYDQKLEEVPAGVPAVLPPMPEGAPANRLGLAQWLVAGDNPLTARVTVNRLWQQLFGTGLVKSAGDFGTQGETPSHPQLLDWLAVSFVDSGWDVKATLKHIVMSRTYRQSARMNPELLQKDPHNRLLARGPRFRLDAEVIRDQALAAGGLLSEQSGGPGVRPYQPDGLWSAVGYTNSNTVKFARQYGDKLYRRSVYTFWKRTAPPANMTAFDAPNRESCTVSRERTNTPLQALVLMNDVQFVEAARHLAERGLIAGKGEAALDTMSRLLLGRTLDSAEKAILGRSLESFQDTYRNDPTAARALLRHGDRANGTEHDPVELAALTMVASQLLNLDETITKN